MLRASISQIPKKNICYNLNLYRHVDKLFKLPYNFGMRYNELDLNLIKTFLCVYESKSFLLASKRLYISQPAVTASIKRLEEALGGKLFVRTSKGVVPTAEGEELNSACYNAMMMLENGLNKFSNQSKLEAGNLNLGSSSTIIRKILLPFIKIFNKKYPKIVISITDANTEKLQKYTRNRIVDLAVVNMPISNPADFEIIELTHTASCFIAPPEFEHDFLKKEDISKFPLIVQKRPSANRDYFDQMCVENNLSLVPTFEIASFGLITDFVAAGSGIGFTIKDFVLDDIKSGRVKELKTDLDLKPQAVAMLLPKGSVNNFVTQKFIDELKDFFK